MVGEVEDLLGEGVATAARVATRTAPIVTSETKEARQVPGEEASSVAGRPEADPSRADAGGEAGGVVAR